MRPERTASAPTARSLLARRSASRRTVLLATGITIALLVVALSYLVALDIRGPLIATRTTIAGAATVDSSVIVSAAPADDTRAQDAGVRRVISSTFNGAPVIVTRRRMAASGRTPTTVTWTITPDARTITPSQLGTLAVGFAHIEARVDTATAARSPGANLSGHGAQTVSAMRIAIAAVDTVLPIPFTVLSLAGIIALLLCARLLTTTRENEARLVRARGGSVRTLVLADSVEIIPPAAIGAVAGGIIAQAILWFTLGPPTGVLEIMLAPLAALVAAITVSSISGASAARSANGAPRPSSGRAGLATTISVAALLVIVSAIAVWRFLQYGTPVVGRPQDIGAILAPALLLCTAALLSLVLFFPATGWLQRRGARGVGLLRVLPARTLHRNPRLFAGPIALLVISAATAVTAAGYAATWTGFLGDSTRLVTGSDVRATFGGAALATDPASVLEATAYSRLPGVHDVAPALREAALVGDENVTVIGLSMHHAAALLGPSSVLDVSGLVDALHPGTRPLGGILLPKGASSLEVTVSAASTGGSPGRAFTTLWLADALGDLAPISLPPQQVSAQPATPVTLTTSVPPAGPWRLVAVDVEVTATHQLRGFTFGIDPVSAQTTTGSRALSVPSPEAWVVQRAVFNDAGTTTGPPGTIGFARATVKGGANTAMRLMPPGSARVPVAVSRALAQANQLRIGDSIDVQGQWADFTATVTDVVPLVPGVTDQASMIGDLPTIDNAWLRSSEQVPSLHELWISGSTGSSIVDEVEHVGGARVTAATGSVSRRFVGGAVIGLWLGAVGSAAFAIVALIASLASIVPRRVREVGVLRALGMSARDQSRMRREEITVVIAFGLIGILVGLAVLVVTVGTLARSSTPEAPAVLPLALRFDPVTPAILLVALVLLLMLVIGRYLAAIMRAARVAKP